MFSLESPWTLDYVMAPLPPLGIGLSVAVREGGEGSFFSLRKAYVLSFSLLLCLEPCEKFSVGGGGWWVVVVVYSEFSVLLWSKALVLDLDQAEQ